MLTVHNYYQQSGGEDAVFEAESRLLETRGHAIRREVFTNDDIPADPSMIENVSLALSTVWSRKARHRIEAAVEAFRPDIAHFHNTFPLVSPASYAVCKQAGVPVVQTLHNYRLMCANGLLLRDGTDCRKCLHSRVPWPSILHACYRGSRRASAAVAIMQSTHRFLGTWSRDITIYIAVSNSAREIYLQGGLSPESVVVKPHFIDPDPGPGGHDGGYVLYVGRLSPEKGIETLLRAWALVPDGLQLKIVGDGPMAHTVSDAAARNPAIEWLGRRSRADTLNLMGEAAMLVFPSEWRETFGLTIIEAYSRGTPVVASPVGAAADLIQHWHTGIHFETANPADLARQIASLWNQPRARLKMGNNARSSYESLYTADSNYSQLLHVYEQAIAREPRV